MYSRLKLQSNKSTGFSLSPRACKVILSGSITRLWTLSSALDVPKFCCSSSYKQYPGNGSKKGEKKIGALFSLVYYVEII